MKLSTKGRYGLRALIDLAAHEGRDTVSIASISSRQNISEAYLEQLMRSLRKAGLIESVRGAGGGYRLAKNAEEISVGDALRALEGDLKAVNCPAFYSDEGCAGADRCVTKTVWKRVNDAIEQTVDSIMISELAADCAGLEENRELDRACASAGSR
ncbi:MAG: Rrf2 family transcriptional regulator [Lachnospiraceae bacterium]|nr:Rrf2 family transcriptional regulator [Lachnospiraceae bacterium]